MFENNIYPDEWTKGVIVPIPKKEDLSDVNNYRGWNYDNECVCKNLLHCFK